MGEFLHIVCPQCATVNRLQAERLNAHPSCGKCSHAIFVAKSVEVDGDAFTKHVTRNDIPVLVDFWAPWCGPCLTMAPAYENAAQRLEPAFRLLKLDTEKAQDLAVRYTIRSIPTLALFKNGREVARRTGAMDAGGIVAWAQSQARTQPA
ncbi:thioredoxin TrxC [Noviherbaspirillum suwonense]|uniref:Thioredoxin n=1 Tax=Noviherbaspirillum suwonense TaxID=1224511 RepID=A0ABY1QV00_9BURK|nr:thioredoxin TrxC [Noviherbaspirillum suwonense]SMP81649.1 thioredoxin [Noviherbaspirillum suwonense]